MAPRRVKIKRSVCNVPRTVPGPQWRLHAKHPLSSLLLLCIDVAEEGMATHSSILAWRIPWTEKPGGLQSIVTESDTTEVTTPTPAPPAKVTQSGCCLPWGQTLWWEGWPMRPVSCLRPAEVKLCAQNSVPAAESRGGLSDASPSLQPWTPGWVG